MAERKFDYANVADVYKEMTRINEAIADTLSTIDNEYKNTVNVSEEAVYGDLGHQLLLDWENTSSNFPNFINKFETWATLIAKTAGKYGEFEKDVAAVKETSPLGATSNAVKDAYVNTGVFSQYNREGLDTLEKSVGIINPLTGETYLDTNQIAKEKARKTAAIINLGLGTLSTVAGAYGAYSQFAACGAQVVRGIAINTTDDVIAAAAAGSADDIASAAASAAAGSADDVASAAVGAAAGSADDIAGAAGQANNIAGAIGTSAGTADDIAGAAAGYADDIANAAAGAASSGAGAKISQEAAEEIAKKGLRNMTQADKSAFADFLGVSEEEIANGFIKNKTIWRDLVKKFHPDVDGGSEPIMDILSQMKPR